MIDFDHEPTHTKMLKSAIEFFAKNVAMMFRMGRCADCDGCKASVSNLGVYFTRCLARELGMKLEIVVMNDLPGAPESPAPPSAPEEGGGNPGLN